MNPGWSDAMTEDYLNILNDTILLANSIDDANVDLTDLQNQANDNSQLITIMLGKISSLRGQLDAANKLIAANSVKIEDNLQLHYIKAK